MTNNNLEKKSKRQLYLSVLSSTVGTFGSSMFTFVLGLMLLEKTGSAFSFGLSLIISPIVSLTLMPIVGPTIDRYSRKKIIILSQLFTIASLAFYVVSYYINQENILLKTVFLVAAMSISDQFTSNAQTASRSSIVLDSDLAKLGGYSQSGTSLSGIFSSVLGASLFAFLPFFAFALFEIATELITLGITILLDFQLNKSKTEEVGTNTIKKGAFIQGLRYIRSQKYVFAFVLLFVPLNLVGSVFSIGMPILSLKVKMISDTQYGIVQGALGAGMVLGGIIFGKSKSELSPLYQSWKMLFVICSGLILIGIIAVLPIENFYFTILASIICLIFGIGNTLVNTPFIVWLQREMPADYQGRVFNVINTIVMSFSPLGTLIYSLLFDLKVANLSLWAGGIFLISGLITFAICWGLPRAMKIDFAEAKILEFPELEKENEL